MIQRNNIVAITFKMIFFQLKANQNASCFKELQHLKQQVLHIIIISRTVWMLIVIILVLFEVIVCGVKGLKIYKTYPD